jgi:hypothetical protein
MTAAALQKQFDLRIPARRPLLPLKAAMVFLDRDEDGVVSLVENGNLSVAFDLSARGAARRLLMVWRQSAVEYCAGGPRPHEMEEVMADILPDRPSLRVSEVKNIFSCNQGHLANLVEQRLLLLDKTRQVHGLGPLSSPYILRTSAADFLQKRRII